MTSRLAPRVSFKAQMLKVREEAIVQAVNRLLAEKGFDAMTVDEVAAKVGIAKASLYKHFPSKEDLAAAAMVRVMQRAVAFLDSLEQPGQSQPGHACQTRFQNAASAKNRNSFQNPRIQRGKGVVRGMECVSAVL